MIIRKTFAVAPCEVACPAGIDVPRYIRFIAQGDFDQALAVNREKIPFPSVCAYVCYAPCEDECRMNIFGKPIAIRALKRLVVEKAKIQLPEKTSLTDKKVAIVGSGPAGLTAAYFLSKSGHRTTVFEALSSSGGMMREGIPDHRLPKIILDKEIDIIKSTGVDIRHNTPINSVDELFDQGYDAVFLALGTRKAIQPSAIPTENIDPGGRLKVNLDTMSTGRKGLYACQNAIKETNSVIHAIANGRKAAIYIDKYLGGTGEIDDKLVTKDEEVAYRIPDLARDRVTIHRILPKDRAKGFTAAESPIAEDEGVSEAMRCIRCDIPVYIEQLVCIGCGVCETVCPDDVIRMSIETNKAVVEYPQHCWNCYNCEICCPVDAIRVIPIKRQKPVYHTVRKRGLEKVEHAGN